MTILLGFYALVGGLFSLFLAAVAVSSGVERNLRATLIAAMLWTVFSGVWVVLPRVGGVAIMTGAALIMAVTGGLFFLPIGRRSSIRQIPSDERFGERFDERDTIFARFDLVPETERFRDYYSRRQDLQGRDDPIRSLPGLLSPGGRFYDPLQAPLVRALFDLEHRNASLADGPARPGEPVSLDPVTAARLLKEAALRLGAAEVGIARLDPRFVYSHVGRGPEPWGAGIHVNHDFVLVFSVEMRRQAVAAAPRMETTRETAHQYLQAQHVSLNLAAYLRNLGYPARAHVSGSNYQLILPAVAHCAGLGELGRFGYLVSPRFGGRIRLGAVSTTLPLDTDLPRPFGVQSFCESCKKCVDCCPSGAISSGAKTVVRGVEKWPLDAERCYSYWRRIGTDCALCMKVCPFSHPDSPVHNLLRLGVRRSAFARRLAILGDDLFYGTNGRSAPQPIEES